MQQVETLFDLEPYGGSQTRRERTAQKRADTRQRISSVPVEPHVEPWCMVRHRQGLHPWFHLISSQSSVGAVLALCGVRGTKVHNDGVTQMVRCPTCVVAQDILRP